ncbi:MAG: hypothetical protein NTW86_08330, partial [Candidatus Sumerlaeota bacterium]|nr:hypothetical protein [Candidatus Sumerlaeota bacterium]
MSQTVAVDPKSDSALRETNELGLSPRIARLRWQALSFANEPDPMERGWAAMKSYDETRAEPAPIRRAKAVRAFLLSETLTLDEGDLLAGRLRRGITVHTGIHEGRRWVFAAMFPDLQGNPGALKNASVTEEFRSFYTKWCERHVAHGAKLRALCPPETQAAMAVGAFGAGGMDGGHRLPRFQMLLERAAAALREEALERLRALDLAKIENVRKRVHYQALIIVYDTLIAYGERWAKKLEELANAEPDAARRGELLQMAGNCRHGAAHPARTLWEAVQAIWLLMVMNQAEFTGSAASFGRLDQYLYPFYEADLRAGRLTQDGALELIEDLFLKCYRTFDFHHTTLGGQKPDGSDATNELSSLCLDAVARIRTPRDVAVRLHAGAPESFFRRALEVARLGLGRPDFWNDAVMIPALMKAGFPLEDARDFAPIGCVEITIPGRCNSRTMCQAMNLAKILEITLNNGRCALTGKRVGLETGTDFPTYESLHAAYRRQAERF